jgi:double-GTPase-like protein
MNLLLYVPGLGTVCPFCLERVPRQKNLATCPHPNCSKELPVLYMQPVRPLSQLPVQVFGWSQHGKSAYLTALTMMLMKMKRIWRSFTWEAVTEASRNKEREVNIYERQGAMPPPTPKGVDDCYVMLLRKMKPWRDRALLVRDCPGEIFEGIQVPLEHAPFLHRSRTIFMFASLPDLLNPESEDKSFEGWTMNMLMTSFFHTLKSNRIRLRGRRVVMVLTKADRLLDLPPGLRNYLIDDVVWAASNSPDSERILRNFLQGSPDFSVDAFMKRYLASMEETDAAIRRWLILDHNAQNFIDLAKDYGVDLRLCLTSATGGPVSPGSALAQRWEPRRVLDPFFWALELERRGTMWARLTTFWASLAAFATRTIDGMKARSNA